MKQFIILAFLFFSFGANAQVVTRLTIDYYLRGEYATYLEEPSYYPDSGVVVVNIKVDKYGDVIEASIDEELSKMNNLGSGRQFRIAARNSQFARHTPADTLSGRITYTVVELTPKQLDSLQAERLFEIEKSIKRLGVKPSHELYKTQNIWTFLELDTMYGYVWQVHFSVNNDSARGKLVLNLKDLRDGSWLLTNESIPGRFKLYPTENMYNFILLDTYDGRTWQVQWSHEEGKRGIVDSIK